MYMEMNTTTRPEEVTKMDTPTTTQFSARYWALARKSHSQGCTSAEEAELRRLSRQQGGVYH